MKLLSGALVFALILPAAPAFSQATDTSGNKLTDLNTEIASLEHQKRTGMYMTAGGLAAQLLSLAFIPTTNVDFDDNTGEAKVSEGSSVPFWVLLGGGTVVGIIGVYKWYDASQQLGPLKAKRYDLGLAPTWDLKRREFGVALVFHF